MLKKNKTKLILSSAAVLLPVAAGLVLWNRLPERMTTHWGADGIADGWSSRGFFVFGAPLLLLALHWLCLWITAHDHKHREQSEKVFDLVMWLVPVLSCFTCGMTYAAAMGRTFENATLGLAFLGLIFVIIGNYLPKCRQNYTIGIKVVWTLASEETWNATHRLAGKVWVLGGLGMMACVFLPERLFGGVLVTLIAVMALLPVVYAWWYYRKLAAAGEVPKKATVALPPWSRGVRLAALAFTAVLLVGVGVACFTGNLTVEYGTDGFTIQASYWPDAVVAYDALSTVEYRENFSAGVRTNGFGSPRLSMGSFHNEELGNYTLYAYTGCEAVVILDVQGKTLVYGGKTVEETRAFYETMLERR